MQAGKIKHIFITFFFFPFIVFAQQGVEPVLPNTISTVVFELPPLDTLIQAALTNSGSYSYFVEEMKLKEQELKEQHKEWFDYINLDGDVGYGQYDQLWLNRFSYDYDYSLLTNSKQVKYYAGLSARIPLSVFINRSNRTKIAKSNLQKAVHEADKARQQVSAYVIELYYKCRTDYHTMLVRGQQLESSALEKEKSEMDFVDSKISFSAYSVTERNFYKSQIEYETAQGEFLESLGKLRLITGIELNYFDQ